MGDQVLINVGKALHHSFRKSDIVGRMGGDEFCVYMQNVNSSDFVLTKCQKLMALIEELNRGYGVTVSIGIALRTKRSMTPRKKAETKSAFIPSDFKAA